MVTLEQLRKQPQEHYMEWRGRRLMVKEVIKLMEEELERTNALLERVRKSKQISDIK
jgi:hypothetical protein